MRFLYSDILPLDLEGGQQSIAQCFEQTLARADGVEIAVGYIAQSSLEELARLAEHQGLRRILLLLGMYRQDGMPQRLYECTLRINEDWRRRGCGEIRIIMPMSYHGKVYCFYKNDVPFAAIMGSANLSFLRPSAENRRQYEVATFYEAEECRSLADHIHRMLCEGGMSRNIAGLDVDAGELRLIAEKSAWLQGIESVERLSSQEMRQYTQCDATCEFFLPLKVPRAQDRLLDDGRHFTQSNINVCYARPRSPNKARSWFEMQLTVSKQVTALPGYPRQGDEFIIVTDDGYKFRAHTTSSGNKQFSAVGDELIMGYWFKGRLVDGGLVEPIADVALDAERRGMITAEMLASMGISGIVFRKLGRSETAEDGRELDVWFLTVGQEAQT